MTEKHPEALANQLLEDAEHHMVIAHCADCRPEDTVNHSHAQTAIAAAAELRRMHAENEALRLVVNNLTRHDGPELEALRKDAERYRFAHGNENFAVCIWDDSDCQWFAASDEQLDKAIAQAVQPTLICPSCKADRFKEDCKGARSNCPMTGTAQAVQQQGNHD